MSNARAPEHNRVGYKRPPRDKQFRPGQSGNPGGRPKGLRGAPDIGGALYRVLGRRMTITEHNRARKISLAEVMILRLGKQAADGDTKAIFGIIKLLDWFPVNNDEARFLEMHANAERTRQKIKAMIEQREAPTGRRKGEATEQALAPAGRGGAPSLLITQGKSPARAAPRPELAESSLSASGRHVHLGHHSLCGVRCANL
jgi:hypothetical protein